MRLLPPGMEEGAFERERGARQTRAKNQKNRKSQLPTKKKSAQKKRDFVREFTFLRARAHAGRIDIFYVHIQRLGKLYTRTQTNTT